MMTERGKIILELVKSLNAGEGAYKHVAAEVVDRAVNEYNELIKRNIIEPPYEHSNNIEEYKYKYYTHLDNNIEEPEGWEESMRTLDMMMINP